MPLYDFTSCFFFWNFLNCDWMVTAAFAVSGASMSMSKSGGRLFFFSSGERGDVEMWEDSRTFKRGVHKHIKSSWKISLKAQSMLSTFTLYLFSNKWVFAVRLAVLKWENPPVNRNIGVGEVIYAEESLFESPDRQAGVWRSSFSSTGHNQELNHQLSNWWMTCSIFWAKWTSSNVTSSEYSASNDKGLTTAPLRLVTYNHQHTSSQRVKYCCSVSCKFVIPVNN